MEGHRKYKNVPAVFPRLIDSKSQGRYLVILLLRHKIGITSKTSAIATARHPTNIPQKAPTTTSPKRPINGRFNGKSRCQAPVVIPPAIQFSKSMIDLDPPLICAILGTNPTITMTANTPPATVRPHASPTIISASTIMNLPPPYFRKVSLVRNSHRPKASLAGSLLLSFHSPQILPRPVSDRRKVSSSKND